MSPNELPDKPPSSPCSITPAEVPTLPIGHDADSGSGPALDRYGEAPSVTDVEHSEHETSTSFRSNTPDIESHTTFSPSGLSPILDQPISPNTESTPSDQLPLTELREGTERSSHGPDLASINDNPFVAHRPVSYLPSV